MSAQKEHREGSENKFRALGIIFPSARNFYVGSSKLNFNRPHYESTKVVMLQMQHNLLCMFTLSTPANVLL